MGGETEEDFYQILSKCNINNLHDATMKLVNDHNALGAGRSSVWDAIWRAQDRVNVELSAHEKVAVNKRAAVGDEVLSGLRAQNLWEQYAREKYPGLSSGSGKTPKTFTESYPGEYEGWFYKFDPILFKCETPEKLIEKCDELIRKHDLQRSDMAVALKALIAAHDAVFERKFQKRAANLIAKSLEGKKSELNELKNHIDSASKPVETQKAVCSICSEEIKNKDDALVSGWGAKTEYFHKKCYYKKHNVVFPRIRTESDVEERDDLKKIIGTSRTPPELSGTKSRLFGAAFGERSYIKYNNTRKEPLLSYFNSIAEEIKIRFKDRIDFKVEGLYILPLLPMLGGHDMEVKIVFAKLPQELINALAKVGRRRFERVEIDLNAELEEITQILKKEGTSVTLSYLHELLSALNAKQFFITNFKVDENLGTVLLQFKYSGSMPIAPSADIGPPILSGKSKGPMDVRNIPPPSSPAYPGAPPPSVPIVMPQPQVTPPGPEPPESFFTFFIKKIPNILLIIIGMFLFYTELESFGSGNYKMDFAKFIIVSAIIGVVATASTFFEIKEQTTGQVQAQTQTQTQVGDGSDPLTWGE